jgi:hypothetical protein
MLRPSQFLTLVAGAGLAFSAFAGVAGAIDTPVDDLTNNPCAKNHDLPQCQGGDDPDDGPGFDVPDLDWCFSLTPEVDCASSDDNGGGDPGETPDGHDDVPSADPATAVSASPNFTG